MRQFFIFGDTKSSDFNTWIGGGGTYGISSRDITEITVPGRNGTLSIDNGRYANVDITYEAFIPENFAINFDNLKAFLMAQVGYKRLEDTYHPEHFRLARFKGNITPETTQKNRGGMFDIVFDCDPRRFSKQGEQIQSYTANGQIYNPTKFDAKPLIRAYGTGSLAINGYTITISTADGWTDIDLETMDAYKGSVNCNGNVTIPDDAHLSHGLNSIAISGLSQIDITPRWWTI